MIPNSSTVLPTDIRPTLLFFTAVAHFAVQYEPDVMPSVAMGFQAGIGMMSEILDH